MENTSPKRAMLFINFCIILSCLMLILTYFLPVEAQWKPFDAWKGYWEPGTGRVIQSTLISLFAIFPYGVGLIVLLGLVFRQFPKACMLKSLLYFIGWVSVGVYRIHEIAKDELYNHPKLWGFLGTIIILSLTSVFFCVGRKFSKMKACQIYLILLALGSLLQQMCEIAWYLLEDGLLLNIGSVTGITSATTLLICLVTKSLVISDIKER